MDEKPKNLVQATSSSAEAKAVFEAYFGAYQEQGERIRRFMESIKAIKPEQEK